MIIWTYIHIRTGEYLQGTESALLHPDADNLSQWAGEGACAALVGEVAKSVAEKCPENRCACVMVRWDGLLGLLDLGVGYLTRSFFNGCANNRLEALEREAWRQRCR